MKLRRTLLSAAVLAAAFCPAFVAAEQCLSPAEMMKQMNMSPSEGEIVASFPVRGMEKMCGYVVSAGNSSQIFYSNGDYYIFGRLIDFKRGIEVGEAYLKSLQMLPPEKLAELKELSTWTIGHGPKEVILLTDPECPYCHQLEKAIAGLEDKITFHVVLYALEQHPAGLGAARRMICTDKQYTTIADYSAAALSMTAEPDITAASSCSNYSEKRAAIDRFFHENGMRVGFPTLVFSNGYHVSGALPKDVFLKAVEGNTI